MKEPGKRREAPGVHQRDERRVTGQLTQNVEY
jgi:hypothetical protein